MSNTSHLRAKNGRTHAVSEPQSGQPGAGFGPSSVHLADPGEQLAYALVYRPIAKAAEKAGLAPKHSTRALRDWIYKSRRQLAQSPAGADDLRRINAALATAGAELVDLGPRACAEMQPVAVEAAVMFVRTCRRYDLSEPEELELAKAYALNLALAKAARARVFQVGFTALSATRTATLDAGGAMVEAAARGATAKLVTRLPAGGDLAAISREHDREARIALLTLREIVADRRTARPTTSSTALQQKVEAMIAKSAADREAWRKQLAETSATTTTDTRESVTAADRPTGLSAPVVAPLPASRAPANLGASGGARPAVANVAASPPVVIDPEAEQFAALLVRFAGWEQSPELAQHLLRTSSELIASWSIADVAAYDVWERTRRGPKPRARIIPAPFGSWFLSRGASANFCLEKLAWVIDPATERKRAP